MQISRLATQYVVVRVRGTILETGDPADPTVDDAFMAFIRAGGGNPTDSDWKTAIWGTERNGWYDLAALVGPDGSVTLAEGTYDVWIRLTDLPERPLIRSGQLAVY